jgi:hypothetical protein
VPAFYVVTVVDTTVGHERLRSIRPEMVDTLEIQRFGPAVQLSLHLTKPGGRVEVIQKVPSEMTLLSVFLKPK